MAKREKDKERKDEKPRTLVMCTKATGQTEELRDIRGDGRRKSKHTMVECKVREKI